MFKGIVWNMDSKRSSKSNGKETETENVVRKTIEWLFEAIKRTFTGHTKNTWIWIILFIVIFAVSVMILIFQYQDETWLFDKVVRWFIVPIFELEAWGWLLFLVFMGVQGILVPIPSELVLLSSGLIWGLVWGSVLGIIGSMFAGILTYYIAVLGGRPMMERFLGQENLDVLDFYIGKYGAITILLARAIPIMPFDPVSYASGFLKIKFRTYFIATLIGSIIRCIFYAWLGSVLYEGDLQDIINRPADVEAFIAAQAAYFNTLFYILVVVLGSAYLFYQFLLMPFLKKKYLEAEIVNASNKEKLNQKGS